MPLCAVATCKNQYQNSKYIFHSFPKNNTVKQKWVAACKRKDEITSKQPVVCYQHFLDEDYKRDLQHQLLNLPSRRKGYLEKDAVPTVYLPLGDQIPTDNSPREQRKLRPENKQLVKDILKGLFMLHKKQLKNKETVRKF